MAARVEAALPRRWAAPASICRGGPDKRAVCGAPIVNGPKAFLVTSAADRVCIIFYEIVVSNYLIDVLNCTFRQFDSHDAEIRCANCMISIGKCAEKALSGRGARRRQNRRAGAPAWRACASGSMRRRRWEADEASPRFVGKVRDGMSAYCDAARGCASLATRTGT
ncbi:hypothetical protein BP1026B_II1650 [Burkholderia pseudomallei 1026b]|uniref:Uncharacterized protein n=1 Tax=Burkholderia pseudomallei (strain 1026b) TaxID=884204 RepID=A0A0H3I0N2_BURP2|nr:hypothetical protein BP1026B_II1650 [Burkholderia pseudomallei 1026b]EIF58594.1 hypothetical protein BP1026A_3336 [Burkholderia pseudomallei 1026a]